MSYVLCVARNQWVWVDHQPGSADAGGLGGRKQLQVKTLTASVPPQAFNKLSGGQGRERTADLLLGPHPSATTRQARCAAEARPATDPPQPHRLRLLPVLNPDTDHPGHPGRGGRNAVGHRGNLPDSQDRSWPGPLPNPPLRPLLPTDNPGDVRARLLNRHPRRQRGKRGASEPDQDLIGLTVPEIHRLLSKLIWDRPATPTEVLS